MRRPSKKILAVLVGVVMVIAGAGAAFAFWTAGGSGTGTAGTGTSAALTVNQISVITDLAPDGAAQTLSGDFNNPSDGSIYVTAVTATGYTIDATHVTAGCTVAQGNYTLGGTATVGADVPTGDNQGAWTGLTVVMNNLTTNQDACKGATLTITYASS
jgi:hypothetical protein